MAPPKCRNTPSQRSSCRSGSTHPPASTRVSFPPPPDRLTWIPSGGHCTAVNACGLCRLLGQVYIDALANLNFRPHVLVKFDCARVINQFRFSICQGETADQSRARVVSEKEMSRLRFLDAKGEDVYHPDAQVLVPPSADRT